MTRRRAIGRWAGGLMLAAAGGALATPATQLVWQGPDAQLRASNGAELATVQTLEAGTPLPTVPLGSVWKLFVYSYLVGTDHPAPAYRCEAGRREPGEEYCCDPGESIERDAALQRSCGAFFAPPRLGLTEAAWRRFWTPPAGDRTPGTAAPPAWLSQLSALQPATRVPVAELLAALQQVPPAARRAAREALLPNTLREPGLLAAVGSAPRFKTWSWFDAQGERWGGAAGWLGDGAPFWLGGPGTGRRVLQHSAAALATAWAGSGQLARLESATALSGGEADLRARLKVDRAAEVGADGAAAVGTAQALTRPVCVDVALFKRYPLAQVQQGTGRDAPDAAPGPLRPGQTYRLRFASGQQLQIPGQPELSLLSGPVPRLQARLGLEDYVARVVDREGDGREVAAARALAVAARSWLRQNTAPGGGCLAVDDDSRAQRVSPRPPSAPARAAAAFTQGLVLSGVPVRYRDQAGDAAGLLGWQEAVAASRGGLDFDALLRQAYPTAVLGGWPGGGDCERLPQAADWLAERAPRWQRRLRTETGFEPLPAPPQVCALRDGVPHADVQRSRIYLREWLSREGRVTLIHEYLHLAFRRHPRGGDETYIERLAQQLADT